MGNCSGKGDGQLQEGEDGMQTGAFTVTNINDDHRLVHKGKMVVTATELIYIDNKTKQEWEWPFKYLRRYGCEGNVFSFEAGRKCANGEGTYAFICKKANTLFNMVARNITQGGVQPDVDNNNGVVDEFPFPRPQTVSPRPQDPEPPPLPPFHPPSPLPPAPLPAPLPPPEPDTETQPGPDEVSPPPPTQPPESTKNYSDLVFTNESSEPVPSEAADHAPYSKISFEETDKLSRSGKKIPVNDARLGGERRHTHAGPTSNNKKVRKHSKKSRSPSCSSTSSATVEVGPKFPSVSESILEGGGERHTITESSYQNLLIGEELREERRGSIDQPTYSNIDISTGEILPPDQSVAMQPEYTNINIGPGTSSNGRIGSGEIVDQPNYENIKLGGVVASTPISTPTPRSDYLNYTVSGDVTTPPDHPNYTNITPGLDVATSLDAPNYLNITPGPNVSSSIEPARSHTYTHHSLDYRHRSTSNIGGGSATLGSGADSMQTYIELDISSKSSQYAQLDIGGGGGGESDKSLKTRDRAMSSSVIHNQSDSSLHHHHHHHQQQQSDYTVLNFEAMAAIKSMREEIQEEVKEKEREKEAKEKAHVNKKGFKKK